MPVNLSVPDPLALHAVPGLRIATMMAGIRKANRRDLVLFALDEGAAVAASSRPTASAPRPCRSASASWQRAGHPRPARQYRQRQCRHRCRRPGARATQL